MPFGLYIYVDGSDLHDVADSIKKRLKEFATIYPQVRVIDDSFERTLDLEPDDLPTWNLGLNFDLDRESTSYLPSLLKGVQSLAKESGRDFVVGYYDRQFEISEDIGFISPDEDCGKLVEILNSMAENV